MTGMAMVITRYTKLVAVDRSRANGTGLVRLTYGAVEVAARFNLKRSADPFDARR
jgi:hypothetical protein